MEPNPQAEEKEAERENNIIDVVKNKKFEILINKENVNEIKKQKLDVVKIENKNKSRNTSNNSKSKEKQREYEITTNTTSFIQDANSYSNNNTNINTHVRNKSKSKPQKLIKSVKKLQEKSNEKTRKNEFNRILIERKLKKSKPEEILCDLELTMLNQVNFSNKTIIANSINNHKFRLTNIFMIGDILCQFLFSKFNNDGSQHDYIRTLRQGQLG